MTYNFIPSPNFDCRKEGASIDTIVLHHTNTPDMETAQTLLTNPSLIVSAHYLVDIDGQVVQLVNDEKKAHHAGVSSWRGREGVNDYSIGVEMVNNGYEPFRDNQMEAVIALCQDLQRRHNIEARNIVAHADVAPDRKVDPNQYFNWKRLYENGIGIYSSVIVPDIKSLHRFGDSGKDISMLRKRLSDFGYGLDVDDLRYNAQLENTINAFKRHYSPEVYETFGWDTLSDARLEDIMTES